MTATLAAVGLPLAAVATAVVAAVRISVTAEAFRIAVGTPLTPSNATTTRWPEAVPNPPARRSTLPNRQCDTAAASVVPISARCTEADAAAGATPATSSRVAEVRPYAMPSAPSISWATSPTSGPVRMRPR